MGRSISGAVTPGTTSLSSSRSSGAVATRTLRSSTRDRQRPPERDSWHGRRGAPQRMLLSPPRRYRATDRGVSHRDSMLERGLASYKAIRVRDCVRPNPVGRLSVSSGIIRLRVQRGSPPARVLDIHSEEPISACRWVGGQPRLSSDPTAKVVENCGGSCNRQPVRDVRRSRRELPLEIRRIRKRRSSTQRAAVS
jgi:hypothetical protein